ncbi:DnaB-like helicase C-terminal domain-containing protein [Parasphingorhabdus pacifica]
MSAGALSSALSATALGEHLTHALAAIEDRAVNGVQAGIMTGFQDIDHVTNGLQPGQLVVVGARPGIGKSTPAVDIARSASIDQGVSSLFLSMEMPEQETSERVLAAEPAVAAGRVRRGQQYLTCANGAAGSDRVIARASRRSAAGSGNNERPVDDGKKPFQSWYHGVHSAHVVG